MFWHKQKSLSRVLFILKNQSSYGYGHKASGLRNSVKFINDMLNQNGISSHSVIVTDNNDIDREVSNFKPTHVFIEALWVVPEKFEVLKKLHPAIKWIIRIHSEIPFLALEGIALEWIRKYVRMPNVFVAANSQKAREDLEVITDYPILYLPNFYPSFFESPKTDFGRILQIGSFGAVRPFKNQLEQAVAAIRYAQDNGKSLLFHINVARIEGGEALLKNLRALFANRLNMSLVEHPWLSHLDFLRLLRSEIDLVMMASFTETFSIVAADAVSQGIPVLGSDDIPWLSPDATVANLTSSNEMAGGIRQVLTRPRKITRENQKGLMRYADRSKQIWLAYLR